MTLDQQIQVWNAVGTWFAAAATFGAVVVALFLADRSSKVRLLTYASIMQSFAGDGSPPEEFVGITAVNLADRPVTIISIGWRVGKRKQAQYCIQPLAGPSTDQCPIQLAHGQQARFMVSLHSTPNWPKDMATGFIKDLSDANLGTFRALIHTSVGQTIEITPADSLLNRFRSLRG